MVAVVVAVVVVIVLVFEVVVVEVAVFLVVWERQSACRRVGLWAKCPISLSHFKSRLFIQWAEHYGSDSFSLCLSRFRRKQFHEFVAENKLN